MTKQAKFECWECGQKFLTLKSAEKATQHGCPQCGGYDIGESREN